jgi:hypothetical protein
MHENRVCVTGLNTSGMSIRPVLAHGALTVDHLYRNEERLISPRHVVEFQFQRKVSNPPHTEDHIYSPEKIKFIRALTQAEMEEALEKSCSASVAELFDSTLIDGKYLKPGTGGKSIGTVRARLARLDLHAQRISFYDGANKYYPSRKITDMAFTAFSDGLLGRKQEEQAYFLYKLKKAKRLFLRVGLTRPWTSPDGIEGCWLQVTAIYAFPDFFASKNPNPITFQSRNITAEKADPATEISDESKSILGEIRKKHPAAYTKWTAEDDARLVDGFRKGQTIAELAGLFQRQSSGIRARLQKLLGADVLLKSEP